MNCFKSLIRNRDICFENKGNFYKLEYKNMIVNVKRSGTLGHDPLFERTNLSSGTQVILTNDEIYDSIYRATEQGKESREDGPEMIASVTYQRISYSGI
jgi:hypothetical protein